MEKTYLMLGGNVGDRMDYLRRSVDMLHRGLGTVTGVSALYESEPWGFEHPSWFLNRAVELLTDLAPQSLLDGVLRIEQAMGRVRTHTGYHARTMDIDILLYGHHVIHTPELVVPHPQMAGRMFVLKPMAELAPDLMHPLLHQTMEYLRDHCPDTLRVEVVAM